jgi:hypothetical protein
MTIDTMSFDSSVNDGLLSKTDNLRNKLLCRIYINNCYQSVVNELTNYDFFL